VAKDDYSFKEFSEQPFYHTVNQWLVDRTGLKPGWTVMDVACGTGAVTRLIADRIRGARDALVVGLDVSASALQEARRRLAGTRDAVVEFVQGRAEEMSQAIRGAADAVFLCNSIHYFADKDQLLAEVRRTLRPGGVFAFNTTFFDGAHVPGTDRFYRRWMMRALRILKKRYDTRPDRAKTQARVQLTADQYKKLLEAAGFQLSTFELVPVSVVEQGWLAISCYADFIEGVLPGIPIDCASNILCEALTETFRELELTDVPRNWLSVVAARP
jgi:ubiquinone/menaquinone biosynthesis C-methylase UbiE